MTREPNAVVLFPSGQWQIQPMGCPEAKKEERHPLCCSPPPSCHTKAHFVRGTPPLFLPSSHPHMPPGHLPSPFLNVNRGSDVFVL